MIDLIQLNNLMTGIDFRSALNTNFENLKNAINNSTDNSNAIYTDVEITETSGYSEESLQVICNENGVVIKQLIDGEWQLIGKCDTGKTDNIIIKDASGGIGYTLASSNSLFEGMPIGYYCNNKALAGTINDDESDPVHAVGWYVNGCIMKIGRIALTGSYPAGSPVYVNNEIGGWTLSVPEQTGQLIQVIGFISDDGKYIDIDIQPWCILS